MLLIKRWTPQKGNAEPNSEHSIVTVGFRISYLQTAIAPNLLIIIVASITQQPVMNH